MNERQPTFYTLFSIGCCENKWAQNAQQLEAIFINKSHALPTLVRVKHAKLNSLRTFTETFSMQSSCDYFCITLLFQRMLCQKYANRFFFCICKKTAKFNQGFSIVYLFNLSVVCVVLETLVVGMKFENLNKSDMFLYAVKCVENAQICLNCNCLTKYRVFHYLLYRVFNFM